MSGQDVEYSPEMHALNTSGRSAQVLPMNRSQKVVGRPRSRCCRSCCIVTLIFLALVATGGVLLWRFLPDGVKSFVEENFNITDVDVPSFGGPGGDRAPPPSYQFNQCLSGETCCNGLPNICDLGVDEIMYAGSHNAMAASNDGFLIAPNHIYALEQSIPVGYRAINLDVGVCNDELQLIHGRCSLGQKDPGETFKNITGFLRDNPRELIVITLQLDGASSGGTPDMNEIFALMGTELTNKMYVHQNQDDPWPTIGSLLDSGKQVILFHYGGPQCFLGEFDCPAGFHDFFLYGAETRFEFSSVSQIDDKAYSCEITRGANSLLRFFGINNFVTLPSSDAAATVNQESYVSAHVSECERINNLDGNIVYVDFWATGNVPEYVQNTNRARGDSVRRQRRRSLWRRFQSYLGY